MKTCPKCNWQNTDDAVKCVQCAEDLQNQSAPVGAQSYPAGYPGPVPPARYMEYVGFWPRLGAWLIDFVLLTVASWIVNSIFGVTPGVYAEAMRTYLRNVQMAPPGTQPDMSPINELQARLVPAGFLNFVINCVYSMGLLAARGATVGKMAIGAKVVKVDGSPIGLGTAIGRVVLQWVLGGCTCGLIYLVIAFTEKKQGVHDLIMGTVVIRNR